MPARGRGEAGVGSSARVGGDSRGHTGARTMPAPTTRVEVAVREGFEVRRVVTPLERPWPELLGGALGGVKVPDGAAWGAIAGRLAPAGSFADPGEARGVDDERAPFVVLDTETTGLAHDAGTLAFLVGLAWLRGGALVVEQWLLQRLGAEAAMLRALVERVAALRGATGALVTYNGASFDLPLLRARLRRHGVDDAGLGGLHLDLLVIARRIWRAPGVDLRLGAVERARLGVRRQGDVPGHAIPAAFWSWLDAPTAPGPAALLEKVLAHNAADLITLPAVGRALAAAIEVPPDLAAGLRVARHHLARGASREALGSLGPWLPEARGLAASPGAGRPAGLGPVSSDERRAWLLAAGILAREGEVRRAAALLESICARDPGDAPAHEALARLLEHRLGDPEAALSVLRRSTGAVSRQRLDRLARKVALRSTPALIPRGP